MLALPRRERAAVTAAIGKLAARAVTLGFPNSSAVRGADRLRELRPRAGRSRWRVLYRQIGQVMWVGAVGPEANLDRLGFARAIRDAERRLGDLERKG